MSDKIFVGGAKEMAGNYGGFHKISFSAKDVETLQQNLNAKGQVNLVMNKRREVSQYGQTHSLTIDTWQPTPQANPYQQAPQEPPQYNQGGQGVNPPPQHNTTHDQENIPAPPTFDADDMDSDVPF